jgi:FMN phosphatase YigB (HAD superfamily)
MWVLFDIDATLVDHDAAFRVGGEALYRASSCALRKDAFLARWSAAHRRSFDRFLNGELSSAPHAVSIRATRSTSVTRTTSTRRVLAAPVSPVYGSIAGVLSQGIMPGP